MNRKTKMSAAITLTLLLAAGSTFASAYAAEQDTCLVGTWVQTGGGPGEWMQQRMPNQQMKIAIQQGRGVMVLQGDGRYTANMTDLAVDAVHNDPAGFRQSLSANASAAGRWSTRDRQLLMDHESGGITTSDAAVNQAAERLRARHSRASQRGRVFYGCRGNNLTTQTEVRPGESFPTHYERVRGDGL